MIAGSQQTAGDDEPAKTEGLAEAATAFAAAAATADTLPTAPTVPIVAIGASAGGLEAIEQFFAAVEAPSRFAFVIVQHLSPDFKNLMVELLAKHTALAVCPVEDGMRPLANAIHLIPPGKTMTIEAGLLRLDRHRPTGHDPRDVARHPIDECFVSLATDRGGEAIGIVLSGSGSDGSRGARAIRAAGGRVLVQLPATARFSSMPQAALEAGCQDEVMVPGDMAAALHEPGPRRQAQGNAPPASALSPRIVDILAEAFGLDVDAYRTDTVQRRVHRRMMLRGFDELEAYANFVADDADEQEALYQDLLIGVTAFFTDPAAFDALERVAVPALAAQLDAGQEVRVWIPGVATGEEAYSIAILLLAHCRQPLESPPLRVFATDIHRRSLAIAGAGLYSEEAVRHVRPEWRQRFFTRRGSGYQVIPALREVLAFSPHDLLRDPPFTRVQLVSCRNVLSYLDADARDRVSLSLANALLSGGHLLLGATEPAPGHAELFAPIDAETRLYRRRNTAPIDRGGPNLPAPAAPSPRLTVSSGATLRSERRDQRLTMAQELLLDRYVPPSLLVDDAGQVVHCFGDAGAWLKAPSGRASLAVLDMVEDALRAPLASAIATVKRTGRPVTLTDLPIDTDEEDDARRMLRLVVEAPLVRPDGQRCLLVSFDDRPGDAALQPRLAALEATVSALLESTSEAMAIVEAAAGHPPWITVVNAAFRAAASRAGIATALDGHPLAAILEALVADPDRADTDQPNTWATRSGDRLSLQPLAINGQRIAILRLTSGTALPTPEPPA